MFTIDDHVKATQGVECRKDADVIDETPMAYKDIDNVMEAQSDLVDVAHTLKQVLCVKGWQPNWNLVAMQIVRLSANFRRSTR